MKKDVRFAPARWQSRRQIALWLQLADTDGTQPAMPDMLALWLLLSNLAVSWRDSMSRSPPMSAMTLPPAMTAPLILASPLKTVTLSPPLTWVLRLVAPLPSSWVRDAGHANGIALGAHVSRGAHAPAAVLFLEVLRRAQADLVVGADKCPCYSHSGGCRQH
nr:hypothetical protein [Noviherbaspirillum suwonense]